jgi:putative Ca2+/H+ antiporter (TMEM165/GDT1 family)
MDALPAVSVFLLIFVAELGDKTQLSVISLSSSYKWHHVFVGAILAFLTVDGLSIAFGGTLLALVPLRYVQVASGVAFVVFGVFPLLKKSKTDGVSLKPKRSNIPLIASFVLIALMELGDKTQVLTLTLAAQTSPILVLVGMLSAFTLLTAVAVLVGAKLVSRLPAKWLRIVTSTLFILLGTVSVLMGVFEISLF